MRIILGFILSFLIAYPAFKKDSLNKSGFVGAVLLGTALYYFGDFYFWILMISFFLSSSLLTKFKGKSKEGLEDIHEKSGGRDYLQVLANGGLGFTYGLLYFITKDNGYILAYAASFAAANADTWSSELGVLSKKDPISILNFRKTLRGESGAISLLGTTAAFLGSLFIAIVFTVGYGVSFGWTYNLLYYFTLVTLMGFIGSIIDSLLGSTLQAKYLCNTCNKVTERRLHHGKETIHIKGLKFVNNDIVNFLSVLISSAVILFLV